MVNCKGLILINDLDINNTVDVKEWIYTIENLIDDLRVINNKGYLNDPTANPPLVERLVRDVLGNNKSKINLSLALKTLYFNLILMLLTKMVIQLEKWLISYKNNNLMDFKETKSYDSLTDLKNILITLKQMMNPVVEGLIISKGISVILESSVGFDSEYELKSSLERTNELISIQLASSTCSYLKVPNPNKERLKLSDFNIPLKESS